jgi:predicted DNA-binding transcriptional regulator AlpA
MDLGAFEQYLAEQWAVERSDVYEGGIGPADEVRTAQPMRPERVLKLLGVSTDELVAFLQYERLPPPKLLGPGRVAWRADEIYKLRAELEEDDD